MAVQSVAPSSRQNRGQQAGVYQLPSADRAAILAGADSFIQSREIERQRQAFIQKNGTDGT